jgi:two-component sensor histidine kinase
MAAMPLAPIANELLTNAVKYGLNEAADAAIRVRVRRDRFSSMSRTTARASIWNRFSCVPQGWLSFKRWRVSFVGSPR